MTGPVETHAKVQERSSLGRAVVLGVLGMLALIALAVARHPTSMQGGGSTLLRIDLALLLAYGVAGIWVSCQTRPEIIASLRVGAQFGVLLGAVLVANHVIELSVPARPFLLVITPVFLALALFGAAGSAAWQRTRAIAPAVMAGLWCAIVGTLILLCAAFCLDLAFERTAELPLRDEIAASGLTDPGAFLVKNMLDAASEGLIRMPVFALFLSFTGVIANAWFSKTSPRTARAAMFIAPVMFLAGASALWHANSLERSARPPFVMAGVALAGLSLCSAHAIWSAFHRPAKT